jgi:hypothetical protein
LCILNLVKAYTEQVLVNVQDRRNDHRYREVLLYERIVQREGRLNKQSVVITIIPYVEFAVERLALILDFLRFKLKKCFALLYS